MCPPGSAPDRFQGRGDPQRVSGAASANPTPAGGSAGWLSIGRKIKVDHKASETPFREPCEADLAHAFGRYREPIGTQSVLEVVITAVPFAIIWVLMWAGLDAGYRICLLLAVPAAGFLVRLFRIQHDCGRGLFPRLPHEIAATEI